MIQLELIRRPFRKLPTRPGASVVAFLIPKDETKRKKALEYVNSRIPLPSSILTGKDFKGEESEATLVYSEQSGSSRRVLLVGLGEIKETPTFKEKEEKVDHVAFNLERLRRAGATAAKYVTQHIKEQSQLIFSLSRDLIDRRTFDSSEEALISLFEGAALSVYKFDRYQSKKNNEGKLSAIALQVEEGIDPGNALRRAKVIVEAVYETRDLVNAPANEIYPETFARRAQAIGRRSGFRVTVFDEKRISSLGMGGILAVGAGAQQWKPPRFLILEYRGGQRSVNQSPIVLIGKGVTFDSGGISLKPSANMSEMKMDMSGAAAVVGTFKAAAELRLPVYLVGYVPLVENMPSGSAIKPGDIVRIYGGKTVEVDNTDAEGRLILADALSYARQRSGKRRPEAVIDLATLTGACVVALGQVTTGMFGTSRETMNALRTAGEETYERVWELPLFDEYEKLIKSDIADVKNVGGKWAGAITAAWFLRKFVGDLPWVHLDIAGTAILEEATPYAPKGGSGVGVRLLLKYLEHRIK